MDAFFQQATPEQVGIRSQHVIDFLNELEKADVCMHSVLLIRHGRLAVEAYYAPYTAETLHRMFSVTKSFTSLAIGLLAEEGKLSLDDRIVDHFPEKLPQAGVHPYTAQITIRDMLRMATAHAATTYKRTSDPDWVKSFFTVEPTHLPGTLFNYDTSSSHTLAGLVEKLTGMPMLDYLRSKFLDEIDFSKNAHILTDPMGIAMGGSGLVAAPMDLAKVAWIVMNGGSWRGKQYLPQDYLEAAVNKQIATVSMANDLVEDSGYGYQFWRVKNNGFGMFGMGGQLAICFPEKDLLLVTTADTQGDRRGDGIISELFFKTIFNHLNNGPLPEDPGIQEELNQRLARCAIKPLSGIDHQGSEAPFLKGGKTGEYVFDDNPMGLSSLAVGFSGKSEGILHLTNQTGSHTLRFGMGKLIVSQFPHYGYRCATSGAWAASNTFVIKSHIIDYELGKVMIRLAFKDDAVTVGMRKVMETGLREFAGIASGQIIS